MEGNNNEQIVFHDDDVVIEEKLGDMSKFTKFSLFSSLGIIIISCIGIVFFNSVLDILTYIFLALGIILGIKGTLDTKKNKLKGKKLSILSIFLPIVAILVGGAILMLNPEYREDFNNTMDCTLKAKSCVDNGDGKSTCISKGKEITCRNKELTKSQYK